MGSGHFTSRNNVTHQRGYQYVVERGQDQSRQEDDDLHHGRRAYDQADRLIMG